MAVSLPQKVGGCITCLRQCYGERAKRGWLPFCGPKLTEEKEFRTLLHDKAGAKILSWLDERRVLRSIADNVMRKA